MELNLSRRQLIAGAGLAALGLMVLTGCGDDGVKGKTLYSVSTWSNRNGIEAGDAFTISFGSDGNSWHSVNPKYEDSGTWESDGGGIVLTPSEGSVKTLVPEGDGGAYSLKGEETFGTVYFPSEEEAKSHAEEFAEAMPDTVGGILESTDWDALSDVGRTAKETISFGDGEADFSKASFDPAATMVERPDEGDWASSNHSGAYSVEVESLERDGFDADTATYSGTLSVGGVATAFELKLSGNSARLTVGDVTFNGKTE